MDLTARTALPCSAERAFTEVATLEGYPAWLGIVQAVAPAVSGATDGGPAWWVDLGARLGPVRRAKRVRMVRTVCESPVVVRFDRCETDGREHSPWVLGAEVVPRAEGDGVEIVMHLHYGGARWLPLLDMALAGEVRRAGSRLHERVTERIEGPGVA